MVFRENSLCTECPLQVFINNLTEEEVHVDQKVQLFPKSYSMFSFLMNFLG